MKTVWNRWLKHLVFLYSVLYTAATIVNSVSYLLKGCYEDPSGNWHELDRAIIVFILILAYGMIRYLNMKNHWLKSLCVYVPTLLLTVGYVWLVGLRDTLATTAYRDIFLNYTAGFILVTLAGYLVKSGKRKKTSEQSKS